MSVEPTAAVTQSTAVRALSTTLATNLVLAALGVASGAMAGRLLGTTGRGELAAIQVIAGFASLIGLVGLPDAVLYRISRRPDSAASSVGSGALLIVATSVTGALLAIPLVVLQLGKYSHQLVVAGLLYLLSCPVLAILFVAQQTLRGRQSFVSWNVLRIAVSTSWLVVVAGARIVGDRHAARVAPFYVPALLFLLPMAILMVRRVVPGPFTFSRSEARALLAFGIPSLGAALPQLLNLRLDQLLLTSLVPTSQLGLYAVAVGWSWAVNPVLLAIAPVVFPKVASATSAADQHALFGGAARLGALAAVAVASGVAIVTPLGIRLLYGSQFAPSVRVAFVLVPAGAIFGYSYILEEGARGLGLPRLVLIAEVCGLLVTVVVLFGLISRMGIIGAAFASLAGYSTTAVILVWLLAGHLHIPTHQLVVPRVQDVRRLVRRGPALQ